ncbi:hypothetical protein GEO21_20160 [Sphingobacterium faecium]|uniref:helix-turn-helix domain-containing protein n=1 Tax=Sphingobacterium faecium TaxID=34087 RepID=UPI001291DF01|nr:helix-turn-helix transcriptional regulator [Sphingobacterium faecium]MQP29803.1 hypothetical protein [Sphingobacterium faecium]
MIKKEILALLNNTSLTMCLTKKRKKLNQADIATIIGVNRVFVTNVENPANRAKYNIDHINLLADHFGMSPKDFLPEKAMLYP